MAPRMPPATATAVATPTAAPTAAWYKIFTINHALFWNLLVAQNIHMTDLAILFGFDLSRGVSLGTITFPERLDLGLECAPRL